MDNWIDWTNPEFSHYPQCDKKWEEFLAAQKKQNPRLEEELKSVIGGLDGIIFMCMNSEYEIMPIKRVSLRGCT
jgi:hypothetical protein